MSSGCSAWATRYLSGSGWNNSCILAP